MNSILMLHPNSSNFSDEDLRRWQAHAPHAGYWLGTVHPTHLFIHGPAINPTATVQDAQQGPHVPPPPYVPPASIPGAVIPIPLPAQLHVHGMSVITVCMR